jgi:hypothetical protein
VCSSDLELGQEDDLEEEEEERLRQLLPFIAKSGRVVQIIGMTVGSTDEWYQGEEGESDAQERAAYIKWLNGLSTGATALRDAINSLGMCLYPPHDEAKIASSVEHVKACCDFLVVEFMGPGESRLLDSFSKVASFAAEVSEFTIDV